MNLRIALRTLWRTPAFTIPAALILAIGIGANTAIFSVLYAVLLRPLAYPEPEQLAQIEQFYRNGSGRGSRVSGLVFEDWRSRNRTFQSMAAYSAYEMNVVTGGAGEKLGIAAVSPGWMETFRVTPLLGRGLFPPGTAAAEEKGALLGYGYWQRRFGGDRSALGKTLKAGGDVYTIVGVLPPAFRFPERTEVWLPVLPGTDGSTRTAHNYRAVGRMRPGVDVEAASADLDRIAREVEREFGVPNLAGRAAPLRDRLTSPARDTLWMLAVAVGLLLLVACANVANLLLARASRRSREMAIRLAMGAGFGQLCRQLLAESLLLAGAGGVAGVLLAFWGVDALVAASPVTIPRLTEAGLNLWVLLFAVAATVMTGVLAGLAPLWQAMRAQAGETLKQAGSRGLTGSSAALRKVLVVAEVALTVALLAGSGLLAKSFFLLATADPGFRAGNLLLMEISLPDSGTDSRVAVQRFYRELRGRVLAMPGVRAAGYSAQPPMVIGSNGVTQFSDRPEPTPDQYEEFTTRWRVIGPGFFQAMGVGLRSGRAFDERDSFEASPTVIINEAMARKYWPSGEDPVGRQLRIGLDRPDWMTIAGVVSNMRYGRLDEEPPPELYVPYTQHPGPGSRLTLAVRADAGAANLVADLRGAARSLYPEAAFQFSTGEQAIAESVAAPRFRTAMVALFALLAAALAMAGVYAVLAYLVEQRRREMGIRLALGAHRGDVVSLVLGQGLRLAAAGVVLGLAGFAAGARLLQTFLYGVTAGDWSAPLAAAAAVAIAALAASAAPAWRASGTDPAATLREE